MKNEQGFSLVELLIVVAIIAIIAAIAVPSLLTSRMAANEASAVQGCRTIGSAEIAFAATNNQQFTDLASLGDPTTGQFVDSRFTDPANVINGYTYDANQVPVEGGAAFTSDLPTAFAFVATPGAGLGRYLYGIGPDQVVRYVDFQAPASAFPTGSTNGTPIGKNN
jgi:prepilin-type N-terminal cleavage/methylation domain-containing protein